MNSGTFQKQDIKIIDELYILFDNTEGLYHEASFNTYEKLIEDVKNNIKKDLYNFDSYSNYQILSIYIAITHMIDSKYYTTDINLSRAKILKFHLSKEALDVKKSYSYDLETIFD